MEGRDIVLWGFSAHCGRWKHTLERHCGVQDFAAWNNKFFQTKSHHDVTFSSLKFVTVSEVSCIFHRRQLNFKRLLQILRILFEFFFFQNINPGQSSNNKKKCYYSCLDSNWKLFSLERHRRELSDKHWTQCINSQILPFQNDIMIFIC